MGERSESHPLLTGHAQATPTFNWPCPLLVGCAHLGSYTTYSIVNKLWLCLRNRLGDATLNQAMRISIEGPEKLSCECLDSFYSTGKDKKPTNYSFNIIIILYYIYILCVCVCGGGGEDRAIGFGGEDPPPSR